MKKIRKILLLIVLSFSSLFLVACNEVEPNENSVTLYLTESFQDLINYEEIPSFTLNFNGTLNTISNVNKTYYTVFSNNDDKILSDAISELLSAYEGKVEYVVVNEDEVSKRKFSIIENGELKNIDMPCDDNKVYDEVAYIALDNGLKLTIDYCRFVSDGKTYYTWRYSSSIAMYLYYPVMTILNDSQKELVLLTLPNKVALHVGPELKLASILTKEEYLDSSMYSFNYASGETLEEKKACVVEYYQDYNYEKIDDTSFYFTYLNNKFKLVMNETAFTITWVEQF